MLHYCLLKSEELRGLNVGNKGFGWVVIFFSIEKTQNGHEIFKFEFLLKSKKSRIERQPQFFK